MNFPLEQEPMANSRFQNRDENINYTTSYKVVYIFFSVFGATSETNGKGGHDNFYIRIMVN